VDQEVVSVLEKIRLTRVQKGISIIDLANAANVSHSYIYYIESKQKVPTLTVLNQIAKALNVDMKDFFL